MKVKYTVIVEQIDDNPDHVAYAPDVRNCSAVGKDWDDALSEMRKALQSHIDRLAKNGEPIPEPRTSVMDAYNLHAAELYYRYEEVSASFNEIEVEIPPPAASG